MRNLELESQLSALQRHLVSPLSYWRTLSATKFFAELGYTVYQAGHAREALGVLFEQIVPIFGSGVRPTTSAARELSSAMVRCHRKNRLSLARVL